MTSRGTPPAATQSRLCVALTALACKRAASGAHHRRDLLECKAREEARFDDPRQPGRQRVEPVQRIVQPLDIDRTGDIVQHETHFGHLPLGRPPPADRVDHQLAQQPGAGREHVLPVASVHSVKADNLHHGFVDQLGQLKRQIRYLTLQQPCRSAGSSRSQYERSSSSSTNASACVIVSYLASRLIALIKNQSTEPGQVTNWADASRGRPKCLRSRRDGQCW